MNRGVEVHMYITGKHAHIKVIFLLLNLAERLKFTQ